MSFGADPIILKAFLNESSESIQSLENDLEALETDLNNPGLIQSVFRALHTIKGNSSFLDLKSLTEMVHEAETILDRIRNGDDQMNQETIDVLFQVVEALRAMIANPEAPMNTAAVMEQLFAYSKSNRPLTAATESDAAHEPMLGTTSSDQRVVVPTIRVEEAKIERMVDLINELKMIRYSLESMPSLISALGEPARETSYALELAISKMSRITGDLGALAYGARLVPVNNIFRRFPRVVRDLAQKLGKEIELVIENGGAELDKSIVDAIADPLTHLIRNSCDHGVEKPADRLAAGKSVVGKITLNSFVDVNSVVIEIRDDGKGIDTDIVARKAVEKGLISPAKADEMSIAEKLGLIFAPGFSTADKITDISGRGVGMDVVKSNINKLKGTVTIQSEKNAGTQIQLRFPLSVVVLSSLYVYLDQWCYAVPLQQVRQSLDLARDKITSRATTDEANTDVLPLFSLKELLWGRFELPKRADATLPILRIAGQGESDFGLIVDQFSIMEEAVIQSVDSYISSISGIQGGIIRKDGSVTIALNIDGLRDLIKARRSPIGYGSFPRVDVTGQGVMENLPSSLADLMERSEKTGKIRRVS